MTEKTNKSSTEKASLRGAKPDDARLKAALKANMARRKSQAKVRGQDRKSSGTDTEAAPNNGMGADKE